MDYRFLDEGYWLASWADKVWVVCPKCKCLGTVTGLFSDDGKYSATFSCLSCLLNLNTKTRFGTKEDVTIWQGPVKGIGHRPCESCGFKWVSHEKIFENAEKIKSLQGKEDCPNCSKTNVVDLNFFPHEPWDHAVDPFFGMELALKESTRFGAVWVYNATHLEELKKFISAKVREQVMNSHSYFQRLPSWIKSAKNRDMVLKAIGKLESKIATLKDD